MILNDGKEEGIELMKDDELPRTRDVEGGLKD